MLAGRTKLGTKVEWELSKMLGLDSHCRELRLANSEQAFAARQLEFLTVAARGAARCLTPTPWLFSGASTADCSRTFVLT